MGACYNIFIKKKQAEGTPDLNSTVRNSVWYHSIGNFSKNLEQQREIATCQKREGAGGVRMRLENLHQTQLYTRCSSSA